jgi:hypothetical protein
MEIHFCLIRTESRGTERQATQSVPHTFASTHAASLISDAFCSVKYRM